MNDIKFLKSNITRRINTFLLFFWSLVLIFYYSLGLSNLFYRYFSGLVVRLFLIRLIIPTIIITFVIYLLYRRFVKKEVHLIKTFVFGAIIVLYEAFILLYTQIILKNVVSSDLIYVIVVTSFVEILAVHTLVDFLNYIIVHNENNDKQNRHNGVL